MQLGASFGHPHLKWLKLDPEKAILEYKKLGFGWVRLGCYWNEIEKNKGKFDFSELDTSVNFCEKENIKVVLTIGMKAPRWPEYHLPEWLSEKLNLNKFSTIKPDDKELQEYTLRFIGKAVTHYKNSSATKVWQVENEPLDPSGPNWLKIDKDFLNTEVELIKKLDLEREILINFWGNELCKRRLYKKVLNFSDIVGLDIYTKHELSVAGKFIKYIGPIDSKKELIKACEKIKKSGNKLWITELQAKPWEPNELVSKSKNPPSFLPTDFKRNLDYVSDLKPKVVLFWGFEFWYLRKMQGDNRYWNEIKKLFL